MITCQFKQNIYQPVAIWFLYFAISTPVVASTAAQEWRFRVYLDDKEIGYHHFHLTQNGKAEQLTSRARFNVTFLKIPVFKYRHENMEQWQNQCLKNIASTTDENGKQFRVEGTADGKVFQLNTHSGENTLPACISTFAYWDKSFLERGQLLNSQTGEYLDVEVDYLGEQPIPVRNINTAAHHYRLTTDKATIQLWYSEDDQWLALQSTTSSGRIVRYLIE